jgi:ubiquinone/menaquinone biosynthesis C-methylase UbiE
VVPEIDPDAFDAFEAAAWEERATGYDRLVGQVTRRLVEPLLDAAAVGPGTRVLDVATGPGHVAAAALERGASVVAIDVADAMVAAARRRLPDLDVRRADAQELPFGDGCFDAVVGNFVILHLGRPERAVAGFARVLAPGGALALTAWDVPERTRLLGVLLEAVAEAGARPPADLPAGPDLFRFSADAELDGVLRDHGFEDREVATIAFTHRVSTAGDLWEGLLAGTVRSSAVIVGESPETRRRIRAAFDRLVDDFGGADGLDVPASVKLASGRKVGGVRLERTTPCV